MRESPTSLRICCVNNSVYQTLDVGEFNAWRLLVMLALVLGIDLPKKLLKGIKL